MNDTTIIMEAVIIVSSILSVTAIILMLPVTIFLCNVAAYIYKRRCLKSSIELHTIQSN